MMGTMVYFVLLLVLVTVQVRKNSVHGSVLVVSKTDGAPPPKFVPNGDQEPPMGPTPPRGRVPPAAKVPPPELGTSVLIQPPGEQGPSEGLEPRRVAPSSQDALTGGIEPLEDGFEPPPGLAPPPAHEPPVGLEISGGVQPPGGLEPPLGHAPPPGVEPPPPIEPPLGLESPYGENV